MKREKWQCSRLNVSPRSARNAVLSQTAGPFAVCPYFKGTSLSLFGLSLEDPNTHPGSWHWFLAGRERVKRVAGAGERGGRALAGAILEIAMISRGEMESSDNCHMAVPSGKNRASKQHRVICICVNLETFSPGRPEREHSDQQGAIDYNS